MKKILLILLSVTIAIITSVAGIHERGPVQVELNPTELNGTHSEDPVPADCFVDPQTGEVEVVRTDGEGDLYVTVFEYDALGREVRRGLYQDTARSGEVARAYWQGESDAGRTLPQAATVLYECAYGSYANAISDNLSFCAVTGVTATPDLLRIRGLKTWEKVAVLDDDITTVNGYVRRAVWYDSIGRPIQTVEKRTDGAILRTSSKLGFRGEELVRYESLNWEDAFVSYSLQTDNTYDSRGRLLSSTASVDDGEVHYSLPQMSAQYTYDDLDQLIRTTYGNGVTDSLSYDLRGWRTAQTVKKGNTDIFSSVLRYNMAGYGANACWNGNIASQGWTHGNASQQNQGYLYDKMSRLTGTVYGAVQGMPYRQEFGYELNTNLETIEDYDEEDEFGDSVEWMYSGNRRDGYSYDANGNVTSTGSGPSVTYNLLNLPATSVKNAGTDNEITTEWSYLADGTKIAAYVGPYVDVADEPVAVESIRPAPRGRVLGLREGEGEPVADSTEVVGGRVGYLYAGSFRINWDDAGGPQLESVASVGGRFVMNGSSSQQHYFITDHLGSTRVVLNNAGSVLERYDYYPYGEKIGVSVAFSGNTDYLYTGKESQNALFGINWYDSAARFQTTDGIFTSLDPLAEKYYHISPYAYCAGNPVNVVDPQGDSTTVYLARNAVSGAGHIAVAVSYSDNPQGAEQYLWSRNGEIDGQPKEISNQRVGGKNDKGTPLTVNVQEFLNTNTDEKGNRYYTDAIVIQTTPDQEKKIVESMSRSLKKDYDFFIKNCAHAVSRALSEGGVQINDNGSIEDMARRYLNDIPEHGIVYRTVPILLFDSIKHANPQAKKYYTNK